MEFKHPNLFQFESDYSSDLHFIPLVIRHRLDVSGLKVGLEAWLKIPLTERKILVGLPFESEADFKNFTEQLSQLTLQWFGQAPKLIIPLSQTLWSASNEIAASILNRCESITQSKLTVNWKHLNELQRYALYKLSTSKRQADEFEKALQEFFT